MCFLINSSVLQLIAHQHQINGGKPVRLIGLMNFNSNFSKFLPTHCIIYCEHLAAKYFKYYKNCSKNSKLQTHKWEKSQKILKLCGRNGVRRCTQSLGMHCKMAVNK